MDKKLEEALLKIANFNMTEKAKQVHQDQMDFLKRKQEAKENGLEFEESMNLSGYHYSDAYIELKKIAGEALKYE